MVNGRVENRTTGDIRGLSKSPWMFFNAIMCLLLRYLQLYAELNPWTLEPFSLPQNRVGHDWSDLAAVAAAAKKEKFLEFIPHTHLAQTALTND